MYSHNIVNFQEAMTIFNACTKKKKYGNLLNAPCMNYVYADIIMCSFMLICDIVCVYVSTHVCTSLC